MKEQQLLMVTTLIMDFQGAKVVIQVKEMLSFSHTILPHVLMSLCDISSSLLSFMELGHLLTRSGLTYPEVSLKVYHDSFCQMGSSISLPWVSVTYICCKYSKVSFYGRVTFSNIWM